VVQTGDWHPWAPSVLRTAGACPGTASPGCYFMYYVGLSGQHTPATHCVGVAWSLAPSGPFTDLGPLQAEDGSTDAAGRPPGCGDAAGYSNIDPAPFTDEDGSVYLYVSTGRRCATPTTGSCPYQPAISVLPLTSTPTKVAAARKPLLDGTPGSWEQQPGAAAAVVENPWMEKRGESYYLLYSGGSYLGSYGMGYATSASPTGDFAKSALNPILAETDEVLSPGGGSVTAGPGGESWLVYHGRAGAYSEPRTMRIDPVYWSGSSVSTPGPTSGVQTFPAEEPAGTTEPPPAEPSSSPAPAPATAPVEVAVPPDVVPPTLTVRARRVQRARRSLVVLVGPAGEQTSALGTGRIHIAHAGRTYALGAAGPVSIEAGRAVTLRLRISKRALRAIRRALRHGRPVRAKLVVSARDAAGNVARARRTVTVVR
jgi:hypothetical protein